MELQGDEVFSVHIIVKSRITSVFEREKMHTVSSTTRAFVCGVHTWVWALGREDTVMP